MRAVAEAQDTEAEREAWQEEAAFISVKVCNTWKDRTVLPPSVCYLVVRAGLVC